MNSIKNKLFKTTVFLFILVSCKNDNKQSEEGRTEEGIEVNEVNINSLLVFEEDLTELPKVTLDSKNVLFSNKGAQFGKKEDSSSYILLNSFDLDLSKGFSVNFAYTTDNDDGSRPQALIGFIDQYSSLARSIPLYIYSAGKRITGVYGNQSLWAESYDRINGESKDYYDSYQLSAEELYFVTINFSGTSIDIYVNSEIYASFQGITPHNLNFSKFIIGALPQGEEYLSQYSGNIYGVKVFQKSLSEKEIIELYNELPYF